MYANENVLCFDEVFGNAVFNCNGMGVLNIDLNCTNFDDSNFDEDDPDTTRARLLV